MPSTRLVLLTAAAAAALFAGAACNGDGEKTTVATVTATSAASTPGGAATAPAAGSAPATTPTGAAAAPATLPPGSPVASAAVPATTKLNLNTATAEQFKTVPNVGDRFVREFNEYRPYRSILQFRRELGKYVSRDQVRQWEQYLYVPVDPNQSDTETLQQIPGVTAAIAGQLIAARPYPSSDAFLTKLATLVTPEQVAGARPLLAVQ